MEARNFEECRSCAGCLNKIGDDEYVTALEQDWHTDCFRCSVCDDLLSSWYLERGGLLFCQLDYRSQFGDDDDWQRCGQNKSDQRGTSSERERRYCEPPSSVAEDRLVVMRTVVPSSSSACVVSQHTTKDIPDTTHNNTEGFTKDSRHETKPNIPLHSSETNTNETNNINKTNQNVGHCDTDRLKDVRKKERLFKRKGDTGAGRIRVIKRRNTPSPLCDKEKSSSTSKLLDVVPDDPPCEVLRELSRARSFRGSEPSPAEVFRGEDLEQGELLGCGFFGEVYRVTHRDTGRVMVMKRLYRVDEDAQHNFLKEVAVLRSLAHPNVLRFVGVLYGDRRLQLLTEYVSGGTLRGLVQARGASLSWPRRAGLARDVARGVRYLHERGVIHRDLTSNNCLLTQDLRVIVADFGLARVCRVKGPRRRYTVVGNPYYMAPEMMSGDEYDEKVDVFSFGIILCEIIGAISADPDELPRRADFSLHEMRFRDLYCADCPGTLLSVAVLAAALCPDWRPPFATLAPWLARQAAAGECGGAEVAGVVRAVRRWAARKSPALADMLTELTRVSRVALGKCVSVGHIGVSDRSDVSDGCVGPGRTGRSRSEATLTGAPAGYVLRPAGAGVTVARVTDIREWLRGSSEGSSSDDDVSLRNVANINERKITDVDTKRFNIDQLKRNPVMAQAVNNIPKNESKQVEKTSFFKKNLLSPKLSRLFKSNTGEVAKSKIAPDEDKKEKCRSKFFIQSPSSNNVCRSRRVRPVEELRPDNKEPSNQDNVIKSDIKLASMGKPMTPVFRRHTPHQPDISQGRFSHRERRSHYEPTTNHGDVTRTRDKPPPPLARCSPIKNLPALTTVLEKDYKEQKKPAISKSNYVSLANLRINNLEKVASKMSEEVVDELFIPERIM